ncbi:hypothetical protein LTR62_000231 [Meristemomyces frigidus]|uniref:Rhodopsin domain-containing protein n=1 Tax=Meristemomyces frigidus TaxID=1508187 RepID=A0AAN7YK50_9PEZI|nr:hypothetical protein LTR62_000231 [Meristemomyces frigidus]
MASTISNQPSMIPGIPHFSPAPTATRTTLVVVGIVFTALGVLIILLRLLTLVHHRRPPGHDDTSLLLSFLSALGFTTASFISVKWGVGRRNTEEPPFIPEEWPGKAIQAVYVIEIFYYLALFFVKLSVLGLYLRISNTLRSRLWKTTIGTTIVLVAQFISTVVVVGVQCRPTTHYWDQHSSGRCVDLTAFFYATNVFTIITDIVIIGLPIGMLTNLQLPRGQKVGLLATFLISAIATLASCIRLYSVRIYTQSSEALKDAAPINTWSFVEIYLAMFCASVPAIKPLFNGFPELLWTKSSRSSSELSLEKGMENCDKAEVLVMKELPPIPVLDSMSETDLTWQHASAHESCGHLLVAKPEPVVVCDAGGRRRRNSNLPS